jgi:CDP-glucose 4,6-dehydratase
VSDRLEHINQKGPYPNFEMALERQRILLTGHTGFTGGWLALWLRAIGCEVFGFALPPNTEPNLFSTVHIADQVKSQFGDIRDFVSVKRAVEQAQPTIIFHLAAQPLVSRSFADPLETFSTNIMGTANVFEAARLSASVKVVVCITTDKVYADKEWHWGYREVDRLGGKDPYSASKACAELVASCYRHGLASPGNSLLVATARGGNIIGGGDWSEDRLVPDFVRSVASSLPLVLRNPNAVRPWQHVLALVHGYLVLASHLISGDAEYADAWNFGPLEQDALSVQILVERLAIAWQRPSIRYEPGDFRETNFLHLDSSKARRMLAWCPPLDFNDTVQFTAEWYHKYYTQPASAQQLTFAQIEYYRNRL